MRIPRSYSKPLHPNQSVTPWITCTRSLFEALGRDCIFMIIIPTTVIVFPASSKVKRVCAQGDCMCFYCRFYGYFGTLHTVMICQLISWIKLSWPTSKYWILAVHRYTELTSLTSAVAFESAVKTLSVGKAILGTRDLDVF